MWSSVAAVATVATAETDDQKMAVGQTCLVVRDWALVMVVSPRKTVMEHLLEFLHGQIA